AGKRVVFRQGTGTNWACLRAGGARETDGRPVVDNFRSVNASVKLLKAGFPMTPPYIVVSSATIEATFKTVADDPMFGWSGFYKAYPDSSGYVAVSSAVFSPGRSRATD